MLCDPHSQPHPYWEALYAFVGLTVFLSMQKELHKDRQTLSSRSNVTRSKNPGRLLAMRMGLKHSVAIHACVLGPEFFSEEGTIPAQKS